MRPSTFLTLAASFAQLAAGSPVLSEASAIARSLVLAPLYTPPAPPTPIIDGSRAASAEDGHASHLVPDGYIVVLDDHLSPREVDQHHAHVDALHAQHVAALGAGADDAAPKGVRHKYHVGKPHQGKRHLKGYSGHFAQDTVDKIRALKGVKYVERDSLVWTTEVQRGAPWGLARISHRKPLGFGTFNRYEYDSEGGEGVDAYVVDTGVNIEHEELEGRARWGKTVPLNDVDKDMNGHGSHVAGTIASAKYGVAKQANIIAVKVLGSGGSGTMSDVVAGVAWVADEAAAALEAARSGKNKKHKGSVANMSLGGGKSQALDDAVDAAVDEGVHFAVAAGNDNRDACTFSPAASPNAITVGASTIGDERAYFSNHGKCVDIFGPGLNILSIWNSGPTSYKTISGTSMASPHVAGLAAYLLSLYPTSFAPYELMDDDDMLVDEVVAAYQAARAKTSSFLERGAQMIFGSSPSLRPEPVFAEGAKPLPPKVLKKALEKLATKGVLSDLPAGTPDLLIFNNYTSSH